MIPALQQELVAQQATRTCEARAQDQVLIGPAGA